MWRGETGCGLWFSLVFFPSVLAELAAHGGLDALLVSAEAMVRFGITISLDTRARRFKMHQIGAYAVYNREASWSSTIHELSK